MLPRAFGILPRLGCAALAVSGVSLLLGGDIFDVSEITALDSLLDKLFLVVLTCLGAFDILPASSGVMSRASIFCVLDRVSVPVLLVEFHWPKERFVSGVDEVCGSPGWAETPETVSPVPPYPIETRESMGVKKLVVSVPSPPRCWLLMLSSMNSFRLF